MISLKRASYRQDGGEDGAMTTPKFEVRWVYQPVTRHGQHIDAGQKPALCFRGRKHALCIAAGYPVRVLKRPVAEYLKYRLVMNTPPFNGPVVKGAEPPGQTPYPVLEAVATLQLLARTHGITAGAAQLLERAATETNSIDEDQFNDEEEIAMANETNAAEVTNATPETPAKEKTVSKRKTSNKAPRKAKTSTGKGKTQKGPSRISQAVEYMRAEVKKAGGQKNLERGWRKELFERAAKKFNLAPVTCSIQYNKQVLNK